jgi:hypothetical protein
LSEEAKGYKKMARILTLIGSLMLAGAIHFGISHVKLEKEINYAHVEKAHQLEYFIGKATTEESYLKVKENYDKFMPMQGVKKSLENMDKSDGSFGLSLCLGLCGGILSAMGFISHSEYLRKKKNRLNS